MPDFNLSSFELFQYWLQNTDLLDLFVKGIFVYIALFWIALIIWVTRDIIHRTNNVIFQALVILLNTFFPVFGLVIYLLIRPGKTLTEKYYEDIEYKAFSVEKFCPQCSLAVSDEFSYCPECRKSLKDSCGTCKKKSFVLYTICPHCGKDKKAEGKKPKAKSSKSKAKS